MHMVGAQNRIVWFVTFCSFSFFDIPTHLHRLHHAEIHHSGPRNDEFDVDKDAEGHASPFDRYADDVKRRIVGRFSPAEGCFPIP